ncbi:dienelactone hydrolase family protein [Marinoscillum sp.]|uniref:dienelactone hydrolase family protein n=1 Tax=Marinoscillum sp. TaxID=2024838 RepID=UPI003BA9C49B
MKLTIQTFPLIALFILGSLTTNTESPKPNSAEKTRLDAGLTQCHATTQRFAAFGNDASFLAEHEKPLPFTFQGQGEMITYEVPGGSKANAFMVKSAKPSNDYLFVVHEWYGLNAYVKNESVKFAERFPEMNVLALDLYDGKVADNSEDAGKYMQSVKTERALAIINAAQDFVGSDANIYTVGWCFGGGWSLQTAIEMGDQAKAAVMFYGMPEQDMDRLKTLNCDVLAIFAEQDKWITPEVASKFDEAMAKLDNKLVLKSYDADHGFANPSNPKYNEEAATDAYKNMFEFVSARR